MPIWINIIIVVAAVALIFWQAKRIGKLEAELMERDKEDYARKHTIK